MAEKLAFVTGASSGIGNTTVLALLRGGYTVYAGARRIERMKDLELKGAKLLSVDVTEDASLTQAVEQIQKAHGRLDVLVNNAGYGSYGSLEDVSLEEARRQFEVNLFGLARLTQLVLPMMRAQRSGRSVNMSSIAAKIWEPFGGWYHASKFALEGLSDCLRVEVAPFGIDVILIEPGIIRSEWSDIAADSMVKASGKGAYKADATSYAKVMKDSYAGKRTSGPEVVAATVLQAVNAKKPKTRYVTGAGAKPALFVKKVTSDRLFDSMLRMGIKRAASK